MTCCICIAHLTAVLGFICVSQLGLGHSNPVKEPVLLTALQGKSIRQISAGRCHSSAWTTPSTSVKNSGTDTHGPAVHTVMDE